MRSIRSILARLSVRALAVCAWLMAFAPSGSAQTIGGEVVEAMTAQPLRAYQVRLVYLAQGDTTRACDSTTTDERGLFQFDGRGAGAYRLEFGPKGTRLASSARVEASTRDTMIASRFKVPLFALSGAQAFAPTEVEQGVRQRYVVPLRYPPDLRSFGVTGEVVVRFVVDSSGRVQPGSVAVLRSSHPSFTRVVTDALRTMRFDPARIGGIPVPQLVEEPFTFSLDRGR